MDGKISSSLIYPLSGKIHLKKQDVNFKAILFGTVITAAAFYLGFTNSLMEIPAAYALSSLIAFRLYRSDKLSAKDGSNRVPEKVLHIFGFLCGWPGGLIAQQIFRHKTVKKSFRIMFWITVILNIIAVALYCAYKLNPVVFIS